MRGRIGPIGRIMTVAATALGVLAGTAGPASAAKVPDPCKLVKTAEIAREFGAEVSQPARGLAVSGSAECTWSVAAGPTFPEGMIRTQVLTRDAKGAYTGMARTPGFEPVNGFPKALWQESSGSLNVLRTGKLLSVQGVFIDAAPPYRPADVQQQVIRLMRLAQKRA